MIVCRSKIGFQHLKKKTQSDSAGWRNGAKHIDNDASAVELSMTAAYEAMMKEPEKIY